MKKSMAVRSPYVPIHAVRPATGRSRLEMALGPDESYLRSGPIQLVECKRGKLDALPELLAAGERASMLRRAEYRETLYRAIVRTRAALDQLKKMAPQAGTVC